MSKRKKSGLGSTKQVLKNLSKQGKKTFAEEMNHDYTLEERVVGNSVYVHSFNANFIEAISSTNLESDLDSWYNAISTHLRNRVNQIITAVKPSATDRKVVQYFQNDEYATILDTVKSNLIKIEKTYSKFLSELTKSEVKISGSKEKGFTVIVDNTSKQFNDRKAASNWLAKYLSDNYNLPIDNALSQQFDEFLKQQSVSSHLTRVNGTSAIDQYKNLFKDLQQVLNALYGVVQEQQKTESYQHAFDYLVDFHDLSKLLHGLSNTVTLTSKMGYVYEPAVLSSFIQNSETLKNKGITITSGSLVATGDRETGLTTRKSATDIALSGPFSNTQNTINVSVKQRKKMNLTVDNPWDGLETKSAEFDSFVKGVRYFLLNFITLGNMDIDYTNSSWKDMSLTSGGTVLKLYNKIVQYLSTFYVTEALVGYLLSNSNLKRKLSTQDLENLPKIVITPKGSFLIYDVLSKMDQFIANQAITMDLANYTWNSEYNAYRYSKQKARHSKTIASYSDLLADGDVKNKLDQLNRSAFSINPEEPLDSLNLKINISISLEKILQLGGQ